MYKSVPTYYNGEWITTDFETKKQFVDYILSIFSEPGKYGFNSLAQEFNKEAKLLILKGFIVINLLDQKILLHIGRIKKINVEKVLYIKIIINLGI
jgi:hypothetical protein